VSLQERMKHTFFQDGPNAIDVPRVQLHFLPAPTMPPRSLSGLIG
jgi:hypothetical protein